MSSLKTTSNDCLSSLPLESRTLHEAEAVRELCCLAFLYSQFWSGSDVTVTSEAGGGNAEHEAATQKHLIP